MENLIRTIGLAPSEMSEEELLEKIEVQRRRTVHGLLTWKEGKKKKASKRKPSAKSVEAKKIDEIKELLASMGTTVEEALTKGE